MLVTRTDVLAAMAEHDRMGQEAFLRHYGYRPSLRYILHHEGRAYPSKAILGVAAKRTAAEFFGGAAHTAQTLTKLGFNVARYAVRHAKALLAAALLGYVGVEAVVLQTTPVAYFASGSNHAGEIRGFGAIDQDVGVAAPELNVEGEAALMELAGTDVQVFVDSGAFSEVAFGPEGVSVVRPIDHAAWVRILGLYRRLALVLGDQLHVVAPDRVGDQRVTLDRLSTYRPALRELVELGAHILVPIQKGSISQADFAKQVDAILGFAYTPAMPMKKAATTVAELQTFLTERQPRTIHLLGVGPRSDVAPAAFAACAASRDCLFTCDSVLIKAFVGRKRKQNHFTAARDILAKAYASVVASWTVAEYKELTTVVAFGGAR